MWKVVVFHGLTTHSSSQLDGDRWALVLFTHASWASVSEELIGQARALGFDGLDAFGMADPAEELDPPAPLEGELGLLAEAGDPGVEEDSPPMVEEVPKSKAHSTK